MAEHPETRVAMEKDIVLPFSNATTVRSAQEMDVGAPIGDDRIEFSIPSAAPDFRKQFSDDVYDFYDNQNIDSPKTENPNSNPQNYRHEARSTKMKTAKSNNNNNNKETTKNTNLKAENGQSENKGEAKSPSPGPDVSMVVDLLDDMTETNMEIVYNSNTSNNNNNNNNNVKDQKRIGKTNNANNNSNNNNNGKGNGWMKSRSNSVSSKLNSQIWLNDVLKIEEIMLNEEKNYNNRILDECSSFVPKSNIVDNLDSKFEMLQELGRGATSRVVLAKNLATNELVALKQLKKSDKFNLRSFKDEFHILSQLSHKNIIELKDCYIDNYNFYIETKYYKGGNLVDCIKNFFYFCEEQATRYLYTIISIINYCHSKNIIHRDLKPGNLVFDREPNTDFNKITASTKSGATNLTGYTSQDANGADSAQLKLIDFGLAIEISDNETNNEYVGTLIYMPPESCGERKGWQLKYGDMWSIGVIAYILVVGKAPFNGTTNVALMKSIISDKLTFPDDIELTDECIDFITKLLDKDCKKRMTAKEALAHPWLSTAAGLYSTLRSIDGTTLQLLDSTPQRSVTMQRNLGDKYKANIQSFLSNESSLRLADKDIPASKIGEKEKSIIAEGDNEIEESAICDYLIDLKMDKKAATLRAKAVFDTINNAQHGHMEPQLFAKMSKGSHGTSKSENAKEEHEAAQDDALPKTTTTTTYNSKDKNNHNNNNNNNKKKTDDDDDDDDDEGNSKSTNQKACCCIM